MLMAAFVHAQQGTNYWACTPRSQYTNPSLKWRIA